MRRSMVYGAVAARWQLHATLETPLRQFQTMDRGMVQLGRQDPLAGNSEPAILDHRLDLAGIDAGQSHQDQHLTLSFQDIHRRLPRRRVRAGSPARLEKLPM